MAGWTKFHLTEEQYNELLFAERQVDKPQLFKKIQCIKLKNNWRKHDKVWDFLEVSIQTITSWTKAYIEGGISRLLSRNYKWKTTILTMSMIDEIRKINEKTPFDTAKEAKEYIKEKYGINFWLHRVQKLLKKNFDFPTRSKK